MPYWIWVTVILLPLTEFHFLADMDFLTFNYFVSIVVIEDRVTKINYQAFYWKIITVPVVLVD